MRKSGCLSLIFFGLLAFMNAVRHPFVHDDVLFILQNPHITELNSWVDAFRMPTPPMAGHALAGGLNTYYRPVLEVLYRLEYHFFGPHPWGFHLFNCLVHIVNGLLLFGLLQKLSLPRHVAWLVSLIFLIHPVQTEAVSCISGISNLWMALGILLALHCYLKKWYTATFLFFAVAFFSKEQAVMFVPLLIVIDCARGEKKFGLWFLWGAVTLILLWLRQCVTGTSLIKDITASGGELYLRLAAIPRDIGMYLRLIFFPYDLHYYRSTDILQSNFIAWALALVSIAGIFYVLKRWPKSRPIVILGLGWFLAALLPVLNIVPLINEYSFILTPEHFLYLPIVGILIVTVFAVDYFIDRLRGVSSSFPFSFVKRGLAGVIIGACLLLTWHQNTFWRSEITLFERMLHFEPDFGRGHLLLAKAYYFNGLPGKAEEHFKRAFEIMSGYAKKTSNAVAEKFYSGFEKEILFDWAQNECALGHWRQSLDKLKRAAAIDGRDAALYNNMAFVYIHLGDKKDAISSLEQALRVDPKFAQARRNLELLGPVTK